MKQLHNQIFWKIFDKLENRIGEFYAENVDEVYIEGELRFANAYSMKINFSRVHLETDSIIRMLSLKLNEMDLKMDLKMDLIKKEE